MNFYKQGVVAFILLLSQLANSQAIHSPYSNYGLGELLFQGLPNNYAMGELGIGTPNPWHINLQNPAFLPYNSFSTFQFGISGDFREYESTVDKSTDQAASLRYMALSFPVVRSRWTTSFALLPLSSVKYKTYSQDSLDIGERGITQFQGDGGITQLIWANGFTIFKTLNVGFKASYIFGLIDQESRVQLVSGSYNSNYVISYKESTSYSDFLLSTGVSYKLLLGNSKYINFGATYELSKNVKGKQDQSFKRLSLGGTDIQTQDLQTDVEVGITLPQSYGFGVSYEAPNNFRVGVDIKKQNWKSENEGNSSSYRNVLNIAVGTEWTPDYKSVKSYINRVSYRLGLNIKQMPYVVNNTEINDFGINFGASFPVSVLSSFDTAFKIGRRGTTDNNLIRENYFQVIIGATINDRWFIKRRYD